MQQIFGWAQGRQMVSATRELDYLSDLITMFPDGLILDSENL